MKSRLRLSRRIWLQSLLGQMFIGWAASRPSAARAQSLSPSQAQDILLGFRRKAAHCRRYRVDATVLVCDIPIFTKKNVGGGYAAVEISTSGDSTAVGLQFAAGSWPKHSAGLNRFGILQESVITRPAADPEFLFRGLITSSKEDDIGAAKKALHSAKTAPVTLARGQSSSGHIRTWTETTEIALNQTWIEATALLETLVRNEPIAAPRETTLKAGTPFLAAMRSAALSSQSSFRGPFVHSGKLYTLETQRHPGTTDRLTGVIRDERGQKSADFGVSYAAGDESGIPTRIDYRPKSYLRLAFELEPDATQPAIASIFREESI